MPKFRPTVIDKRFRSYWNTRHTSCGKASIRRQALNNVFFVLFVQSKYCKLPLYTWSYAFLDFFVNFLVLVFYDAAPLSTYEIMPNGGLWKAFPRGSKWFESNILDGSFYPLSFDPRYPFFARQVFVMVENLRACGKGKVFPYRVCVRSLAPKFVLSHANFLFPIFWNILGRLFPFKCLLPSR